MAIGVFPGLVTRAPPQNGQPGQLINIDAGFVNFGAITVAGVDYRLDYRTSTSIGEITSTVNATQTYRYDAALTPNAPTVDGASIAQDNGSLRVDCPG